MNSIYQDIAERTNGDIYIGVVGPVRVGKSTFVSQFVQKLVLPNIADKHDKKRALDELPQSADGKMIMTTQPNFVPNKAVKLSLGDNATANVRLIDCVGYVVEGAEGYTDGDKSRLVNTPWSAEPIPFEKAAELGTQKVAEEHSTVAIVVTTDGTIGEIPRKNYVLAEERTVKELQTVGKPFVIVLNSKAPNSEECKQLAMSLQDKYGVCVLPMDVQNSDSKKYEKVLQSILCEFPVRQIAVNMPMWMRALSRDNKVICDLIERLKTSATQLDKMKDADKLTGSFDGCDYTEKVTSGTIRYGSGCVEYDLLPKQDLFFKVLSDEAQTEICDEYSLMNFVSASAYAKHCFEEIKDALAQADATGYGIVYPQMEKMLLDEPQMIKQGNVYGVRLTAKAPSYHIIKVDVNTDVSPMVGTEQQSKYLLDEYKQNPQAIWNLNMFGKTMSGIATEGLEGKCSAIPQEVKTKLNRTLSKIVNENRGGLICLLL